MSRIASDEKAVKECISSSPNQSRTKKKSRSPEEGEVDKIVPLYQDASHHEKYKTEFETMIEKADKHIKSKFIWANAKPHKHGFGAVIVEILFNMIQQGFSGKQMYLFVFDPGMCLTLAEIIALYIDKKTEEHPRLYVSATDTRNILNRPDYKKILHNQKSIMFGSPIELVEQPDDHVLWPNRIYFGIEDLNLEDETCHPLTKNPTNIVFFCHDAGLNYFISLSFDIIWVIDALI
jgi:hypothetical protein